MLKGNSFSRDSDDERTERLIANSLPIQGTVQSPYYSERLLRCSQ